MLSNAEVHARRRRSCRGPRGSQVRASLCGGDTAHANVKGCTAFSMYLPAPSALVLRHTWLCNSSTRTPPKCPTQVHTHTHLTAFNRVAMVCRQPVCASLVAIVMRLYGWMNHLSTQLAKASASPAYCLHIHQVCVAIATCVCVFVCDIVFLFVWVWVCM